MTPPDPEQFEQLGAFYLGRARDSGAPLLYDSRDLTTHAICVGMTGSGKTGLCIAMLEEAAIDGVPALIIDPKGDLTNLALLFPELRPEDFRPWVSPDEARRKGVDEDTLAAQQASAWKNGLASWGQDGARIRRLLDETDVKIFTPGSTAGTPVSVVSSFDPPPQAVADDPELLAERVESTARGVLGLAGISADGRESTLVQTILAHAWSRGEALSLVELVRRIQKPPFDSVGVLDLESFFPEKDRFALVLAFNNLIASPAFRVWTSGPPLDVGSLLYSPSGKPRLAVLSIAHLGDAERMFFVSLLLNAVVSWMRTQPGTTSLRAIVYMDEVFGYFPPTANPPSKKPLLTLMKQARAFGVGIVLATQNPADLDYKSLANAGTWLIGRLQTERDKLRLLDGLVGTGAGMDRAAADAALSSLGKRMFLLKNVHDPEPVVFESRWAMSYLCGPLTRDQIRSLSGADSPASAPPPPPETIAPGLPDPRATLTEGTPPPTTNAGPPLVEGIPQVFENAPGQSLEPRLLVSASIRYREVATKFDETRDEAFLAPFPETLGGVDWSRAEPADLSRFAANPPAAAQLAQLPQAAARRANYATWTKDFTAWAPGGLELILFRCPKAKLASNSGETEAEFRVRLAHRYRELRDEAADRLRDRYAKQLEALGAQEARAREAARKADARVGQERLQTAMSVGSTVLGALLGRKAISASTLGRATTAARGAGRTAKAGGDAAAARAKLVEIESKRDELAAAFQTESAQIAADLDALTSEIETVKAAPMKTGTRIRDLAIAWVATRDAQPPSRA